MAPAEGASFTQAHTHLALSVHTHVHGVIPAQRAVHHSRSALGVEVVSFRQAVERTRFHATYTHTHTHLLRLFKLVLLVFVSSSAVFPSECRHL